MASEEEKFNEFWKNVWDHVNEPILQGYDIPFEIPSEIVEHIIKMATLSKKGNIEGVKQLIHEGANKWDGKFIYLVLQLSGLTRTKILTDLNRIARDAGTSVPSDAKTLPNRIPLWNPAKSYLADNFANVVEPLEDVTPDVIEALNRATWPGYVRQEKAKRGGHACEQKLAIALKVSGILFEPVEKVSNPMYPDAQVQGESFDAVVPCASDPVLCFKSTVHISPIGQYGQSKDALEVIRALRVFDETYGEERPKIMALVDGVGYRGNPTGLKDVLKNADEFCQLSTLWKAVVVASHLTGDDGLRIYLSDEDFSDFDEFLNRYGHDESKRLHIPPEKPFRIGRALFERIKPSFIKM